MEGIVKQASNAEYWDIWNRQKLGPDFELKQQQILKADQVVPFTKTCIFYLNAYPSFWALVSI